MPTTTTSPSRWLLPALVVSGLVAGSAALLFVYFKLRPSKEVDEGYSEVGASEPVPKKVLILGLEGAGKSSLLKTLTSPSRVPQTSPTGGFDVVTIRVENSAILDIWEIGGGESVRKYWSRFVEDTQVLVFVIDSADRSSFPEAYTEMHKLLGDSRLRLKPFIVIANKQMHFRVVNADFTSPHQHSILASQDLDGAADSSEIKEALGLEDIKHHRVKIIPTSFSSTPALGLQQVRLLLHQL